MSREVFKNMDPEVLRGSLVEKLEMAIERFDQGKTDLLQIYTSCSVVWTNMLQNENLAKRMDEAIKLQRMAVHQMAAIDMSKGDPIIRRYNPDNWLRDIPTSLENRQEMYLMDKARSLLNLLKIIADGNITTERDSEGK